jgi:hypothetical protein
MFVGGKLRLCACVFVGNCCAIGSSVEGLLLVLYFAVRLSVKQRAICITSKRRQPPSWHVQGVNSYKTFSVKVVLFKKISP